MLSAGKDRDRWNLKTNHCDTLTSPWARTNWMRKWESSCEIQYERTQWVIVGDGMAGFPEPALATLQKASCRGASSSAWLQTLPHSFSGETWPLTLFPKTVFVVDTLNVISKKREETITQWYWWMLKYPLFFKGHQRLNPAVASFHVYKARETFVLWRSVDF